MIKVEFKDKKEYFAEISRLVGNGIKIKTSLSRERGVIRIIQ